MSRRPQGRLLSGERRLFARAISETIPPFGRLRRASLLKQLIYTAEAVTFCAKRVYHIGEYRRVGGGIAVQQRDHARMRAGEYRVDRIRARGLGIL